MGVGKYPSVLADFTCCWERG